jgi:hypothetical protein
LVAPIGVGCIPPVAAGPATGSYNSSGRRVGDHWHIGAAEPLLPAH